MKRLAYALAAVAVAVPFAVSARAAKEKEPVALRYAHSWADAVGQARDRNAIIFATFHKDN
jgi:hypothetical protein